MTSAHPWLTDISFVASAILFLAKFVNWEEARTTDGKRRWDTIAIAGLCTALLSVLLIWVNHQLNKDVKDYSAIFARELDKPLDAIYAICTLDRDMDINELGNFGFLVELHDLTPNTKRSGLYISSFYSVQSNPTIIPRRVPDGVIPQLTNGPATPGMDSFMWLSPPFQRLAFTRVLSFTVLNRLEAGGGFRKSPVPLNVGDLDGSLIQVFLTPEIFSSVKALSLVANDFVIYDSSKDGFKWPRVTPISPDDRQALPDEIKERKWLPLPLAKYTLTFSELKAKTHKISSLEEDVLSVGLDSSRRGWLPEK